MADGREETRLAEIGFLGQHLRLSKLAVDAGQLRRSVGDALLQRLVGHLQRFVGMHPGGDVGIGCDHAAVRHRARSQLDGPSARLQFDLPGLVVVRQAIEKRRLGAGIEIAALNEQVEDLAQRHANLAKLLRQVEQRPILAVPAGQPEIAVEDGDALRHLVERDLQQVAILLQCLRCVVQ